MHAEARLAVERIGGAYGLLHRKDISVINIGGPESLTRNLFATRDWTTVNLDTWAPDRFYDVALCVGVLEHTPSWRTCLAAAAEALKPGGSLIVVCASDRHPPHSVNGTTRIQAGEHYSNIQPMELVAALADVFPGAYGVDYAFPPGDVYAWAQRPTASVTI